MGHPVNPLKVIFLVIITEKLKKNIELMKDLILHNDTVSLTIYISYTLPILTLFQSYTLQIESYTLPIFHSSNLSLFQSFNLPILHSSNHTLFQSYTLHSYTIPIKYFFSVTLFQSCTLFQSYALSIILSFNITLFQSSILHSSILHSSNLALRGVAKLLQNIQRTILTLTIKLFDGCC